MSEVVSSILACAAGMVLGLFFFGGLWLTVRKLPATHRPAMLTLGSLLGRMAVTITGFYLVTAQRWERLLACLAGFVLMRLVMVAWLRPEGDLQSPPRPGGK